ncbi:Sec-independent protein translocase subunit TatA [Xylella taiwanensis]|uniref:Sec-independent protein translocase protein TatA n=1 Tax=Xylella taiwanensis TaxID=1444770 RepID=Z9JMS0_9GAMM|nr:Sec-independent protein translocase subunit TatA [Xylella taiwanensis]AXI84070.1 preprotein translocase subunit TatA [Xylella taiwanensis]EWS79012.1 preprotein translocase subunit TatA [Xylella taiwanensis]MCD8457182.1 Sec-independent protein translocase subunit TatA [Xylella taiwanensis]MCD8459591.1 Sec-independent protein translocase subunit TatA [Xylella taiwanensis]MCD8461542.1 Sec-independent protein translocase subunit TatA [Xylella taiwanensis]
MGSFSFWHWLVVLVIVLLVFGTKRLTNGARDIGNAINEFKKGLREDEKPTDQLSDTPQSPVSGPHQDRGKH